MGGAVVPNHEFGVSYFSFLSFLSVGWYSRRIPYTMPTGTPYTKTTWGGLKQQATRTQGASFTPKGGLLLIQATATGFLRRRVSARRATLAVRDSPCAFLVHRSLLGSQSAYGTIHTFCLLLSHSL
jgi:hypothetical protein